MKRLYSLRGQFSKRFTAVLLAGFIMILGTSAVQAKERIGVAIISFSPYAPWYIVKEKGMLKDIDLDIQIIEDITAKNAALASGNIQCMLNTQLWWPNRRVFRWKSSLFQTCPSVLIRWLLPIKSAVLRTSRVKVMERIMPSLTTCGCC